MSNNQQPPSKDIQEVSKTSSNKNNAFTPIKESAYMMRQNEKAHTLGLSPKEEMHLVKSEIIAKMALEKFRAGNKTNSPVEVGSASQKDLVSTFVKKLKTKRESSAIWKTGKMAKVQAMEPVSEEDSVDWERISPDELQRFVDAAREQEENLELNRYLNERQNASKYIIHPQGKFRTRWDLFTLHLIGYNAIWLPVSFETSENWLSWGLISVIEAIIDMFFLMDVVVNFFSAYESYGKIEFNHKRIVKHYLNTWFLVDFFSAFPFYLFLEIFNDEYSRIPQLTKMLRMSKLIRLFRMFKIMRILNRLEYALLIRSTVSSIIKFAILVFLTSHWFSCAFYSISSGLSGENGWVAEQNLSNTEIMDKYVASAYWSIMTMTTVGFGDVYAKSFEERIFSIFGMIVGAGIFAYGITNVVAMVSDLNLEEKKFRGKMDKVNQYMQARHLPAGLCAEIREFFHNARRSKETKLSRESEILNCLSSLLRSKIALAVNDSVLHKMPFFDGADPYFLLELALDMHMVCFPPLEDVIIEGEIGEEMFFIFRGTVEVLSGGQQLVILGENQYFGEMAILNSDCRRTATIRTICFCELRMLTRKQFLLALEHFPKMKEKIYDYAQQRNMEIQLGKDVQDLAVEKVESTDTLETSLNMVNTSMEETMKNARQSDVGMTYNNVVKELVKIGAVENSEDLSEVGKVAAEETKKLLASLITQQSHMLTRLEHLEEQILEPSV